MKVKIHTAKTDLYRDGLRTPANNKQGYSLDRSKPAVQEEGEESDEIIILKGQKYYSWHPKRRPWVYSLTPFVYVKPYNEYDETLAGFQARIQDIEDSEEDNDEEENEDKDSLISEIEEFKTELEDRLSNMPEQLQESSVLNERIEELGSLLSDLE